MADLHGRRSMSDEDFEEEDIWSVVKEKEDSSPKFRKSKDNSSSSPAAWRLLSAPRMIPRGNIVNPLTTASTATHEAKVVRQSSAPVDIPDWSMIYGKNTRMGSCANNAATKVYYDGECHCHSNGNCYRNNDDFNQNEEEEYDEDDEMVPPHEWIAQKLARSQISSFSVCEGVGRTLKGRDLRKVRNAILTKTGFLE